MKGEIVAIEREMAPPSGGLVIGRALIGLAFLLGFVLAGGQLRKILHLPLPGPVVGLAVLAVLFLTAQRAHSRMHRRMTENVAPVSRLLVSHMGLLFVPAGVGIITEGAVLSRQWLPIVAGLAGSTLAGLVATGWLMQRFGSKAALPKS